MGAFSVEVMLECLQEALEVLEGLYCEELAEGKEGCH